MRLGPDSFPHTRQANVQQRAFHVNEWNLFVVDLQLKIAEACHKPQF